ncbi:MAG: exodeoxyribonuclease VII large subunit [bacterium]
MNQKIYTVSEISQQIKQLIESQFTNVWIEGEISNIKYHTSGHIYFSLKDEKSNINAVIWSGQSSILKFKLENGQKVTVLARLSAYIARSQYQLIVLKIDPSGKGALQLAFEQLKAKLEKEGLFDSKLKKAIPVFPRKIGIVTSPTGAALRDILSVLKRRFSNLEVLIYPVRVQGDEAKFEISRAIVDLNNNFSDLEVIIIARGGGSIEDLWAFNEEIVARSICDSNIPIISAVGHEIDYTISDYAADKRAPTPSAAAEMVIKAKEEFVQNINSLNQRLINYINNKIAYISAKVNFLINSKYFTYPFSFIEERSQEVDDLTDRITLHLNHIAEVAAFKFDKQIEKLELLSPLACLARGYSILWKMPEKKIVKDTAEISNNQELLIKLHKGEIKARAEK